MGLVKLPSGKTAKVPDGLTEGEVLQLLFDRLPEGEDKDRIGDRLETSGWGATIGGALGGLAGGIGGIFTSPSLVVNPITLGATLGAAGSALGEGIEQAITGKGDWGDIGTQGAIGGALGLVPGVGGQAAKSAIQAGLRNTAATGIGVGTNTLAGAVAGGGASQALGTDPTTGAVIGGVGGAAGLPLIGRLGKGAAQSTTDFLVKRLGLDKAPKSAFEIATESGKGHLESMFLAMTGRSTAGALKGAQVKFDFIRNANAYLFNKAKEAFKSNTGKAPNTAETQQLKRATEEQVKLWANEFAEPGYMERAGLASKVLDPDDFAEAFPDVADVPEHLQIPGIHYAMGGEVKGLLDSGKKAKKKGLMY